MYHVFLAIYFINLFLSVAFNFMDMHAQAAGAIGWAVLAYLWMKEYEPKS